MPLLPDSEQKIKTSLSNGPEEPFSPGGETLLEIAQAVRRLTRQAYPEAPQRLRESLARDHFIDALSDIDMQWRVHQRQPQTLNDALTIAVELEVFMSAHRQQNRPTPAVIPGENNVSSHGEHQGSAAASTSAELQEIKVMLQKVMKDKSRPYGKYKGCHTCGDKFHFQWDCPLGRAAEEKETGNGSQASSRS